jgi:Domain of unknown function (DUF4360)
MNLPLKSVLLAGCTLICGQALAQDKVHITSLEFAGSGCNPQDSSGQTYDVDEDGLADQFAVSFSNFVAEQPGSASNRRKNCTIKVGLHLPQGYQFSVASVQYEGAAQLPAGVFGQQKSSYEFPLWSNEVTLQTVLAGPYSQGPGFPKDYNRTDSLGIESVVWSQCGLDTPVEIETVVALGGNRTLPAMMTLDNVDGKVKQIYGLMWRRCR